MSNAPEETHPQPDDPSRAHPERSRNDAGRGSGDSIVDNHDSVIQQAGRDTHHTINNGLNAGDLISIIDAIQKYVHPQRSEAAAHTQNNLYSPTISGENVVIGTQNYSAQSNAAERNPAASSHRPARSLRLVRTRADAQQAGAGAELAQTLDELEQELCKGPNASLIVVKQKLHRCKPFRQVYRTAVDEMYGFGAALPTNVLMALKDML